MQRYVIEGGLDVQHAWNMYISNITCFLRAMFMEKGKEERLGL